MRFFKKNKDLLKYIVEGINEIIENPYDSAILKGVFKGKRKKRKGSYKIIFKIKKQILLKYILDIRKRGSVYKKK